jgi:hypothetical protein
LLFYFDHGERIMPGAPFVKGILGRLALPSRPGLRRRGTGGLGGLKALGVLVGGEREGRVFDEVVYAEAWLI